MLRRVTTHGELYENWPWIRQALMQTAAKTHRRYIPEDVWVMLSGSNAMLFLVEGKRAFMILQVLPDSDGPVLFVFALWGEAQTLAPIKEHLYAALEDVARALKCKRIRCEGREGWKSESFWEQVAVVYEHEVGNGQA